MAEAIKLFSKSLTETDTRKRLAIPAKILPDLPEFNASHAVNLNLLHGTKMWPIVCTVRKNGYKKPVFSCGWRNFVIYNNLNVNDELTLYKLHDEAGSSYYRVEVVKPTKPLKHLSPLGVSCLAKIPDFEYEQELLSNANAQKKEEGAFMEPVADDTVVNYVGSKPSCWLFGTDLRGEPTSAARLLKTDMKFNDIAMCIDEPPLHSSYNMTKEEGEIKFFGLAECGAMGYGTNQACCKRGIEFEKHTLDFLGQPASGEMNLDLTLAPPTGSASLC